MFGLYFFAGTVFSVMALGSLNWFYFIHSTDKATFICYICEVKKYKKYINNVEDFFLFYYYHMIRDLT